MAFPGKDNTFSDVIGASGGSTSGAMKQIRIIILIKFAIREIQKCFTFGRYP